MYVHKCVCLWVHVTHLLTMNVQHQLPNRNILKHQINKKPVCVKMQVQLESNMNIKHLKNMSQIKNNSTTYLA